MLGKGRVLMREPRTSSGRRKNPYVRDFIDGKAPEVEDVDVLLSTS